MSGQQKITSATPEQWAAIEKLKQECIDAQTDQYTDEEMINAVYAVWASMGLEKPLVLVAPSPWAAIVTAAIVTSGGKRPDGKDTTKEEFAKALQDQPRYCNIWWRYRVGWLKGGKILGVKYDDAKFDLLEQWASRISFVVPYSGFCVIAKNPVACHWQENRLHNESGPAVKWADNYSMWAIGGVAVTEKIVMRPDTFTVEEINQIGSEEVKRIAIERFGWEKYLVGMNANKIDERSNPVDNTYEVLWSTPDGIKVLMCGCPTTSRTYALPVTTECNTCADAQRMLSSGLSDVVEGAT
jgi:hypothetical protein